MALTAEISRRELERVGQLAYAGKQLNVMLCYADANTYSSETLISTWESVEVSGNGYSRYVTTISTGSYNTTKARFEFPALSAQFSASGGSLVFDRVVIWLEGSLYPHSVVTESVAVTLPASATRSYKITLNTDD